ncbi:MAG: hypothetical protein Q8L78_04905 [Coxiellaceae bacterium]|nr:hypothetical protein [Coxiellaceae bacterium]
MRQTPNTTNVESLFNQLRSFYALSKNRRTNKDYYYFKASQKELLDLTQLAAELNAINATFEIPHTNPSKTQSLFDFIMDKCTLNEWSKPEAHTAFEEILTIFIANSVDLSVTSISSCLLPTNISPISKQITASSFFQIMLNKAALKNTFYDTVIMMNDMQLRQLCFELSEMPYDKIVLAASSSEFYKKLSVFITALAEKNVSLDITVKQKLKTILLLFAEAAENIVQEPYPLENTKKIIVLFPFNKELVNLYQSITSSTVMHDYFSDDTLFLNCLKKKNISLWLKDNAVHIPWDFLSEIMLQTYSQEKLIQTFIQLSQMGLTHHLIKLQELSVKSSQESWILYANRLIRMNPFRVADVSEIQTPALPPIQVTHTLSQVLSGYRYHALLGRTLIFTNDSNYLAIKVQKKEESLFDLEKEYSAMQLFSKQSTTVTLQSDIPLAKGIYLLPKSEITKLFPIGKDTSCEAIMTLTSLGLEDTLNQATHCLIYTVNNYGYFTYLHDHTISSDNFATANQKIVSDLVATLKEGIVFDRLADIFHTQKDTESRTDSGRYLVLVALLRRHHAIHLTHSSGRVDRWQEAIRYVNLRASGLADLGDYSPSQLFYQKSWFQEVNQAYTSPEDILSSIFCRHTSADPDFKTLINANIIAEYLFILTLVCGKRAVNSIQTQTTLSRNEKQSLWLAMAKQVVNNASLMIHLLTPLSQKNANHYLLSFISIDRLARQMQYWMTADYVMDFNEGIETYQQKLFELYDPDVKITFDIREITSFKNPVPYIEGIGLSLDGINQDLGAFNAQNPMKEDNKIYYMVPALISLLNTLATKFRNAFEQFEASLAIKDFRNALALITALKSYTYPHSAWQKKCTAFCYARVLHAAHQNIPFSDSIKITESQNQLRYTP